MTFTIHQHSDDILVFCNEKEFLRVARKFNWWGILRSDFMMDGRKILRTTYDNSFFRVRISILHQGLPQRVYLEKKKGRYGLIAGEQRLTKTKRYFKNPVQELFVDGLLAAQVETDLGLIIGRPTIYTMKVEETPVDPLFFLLLFLLDLAPTPS